ncbi:MAG: hypothetical protein ACKPKO_53085, partial [Candidatus Fonsibacter sp.]
MAETLHRSREDAGLTLDALQLVVMRYLVWYCSTAGVEQRFSVGDRVGVDRTPASHIIEISYMRTVFVQLRADERV